MYTICYYLTRHACLSIPHGGDQAEKILNVSAFHLLCLMTHQVFIFISFFSSFPSKHGSKDKICQSFLMTCQSPLRENKPSWWCSASSGSVSSSFGTDQERPFCLDEWVSGKCGKAMPQLINKMSCLFLNFRDKVKLYFRKCLVFQRVLQSFFFFFVSELRDSLII